MQQMPFLRWGFGCVFALALLSACAAPVSPSQSLTPSPTVIRITSTAVPQPSPTPTPLKDACFASGCITEGHAWLAYPIDGTVGGKVDSTYRYASTASGKREPHTGVEIQAPAGTAVHAAADGVVVAAGDLTGTDYDALRSYGNVVVLRHDFPDLSQPLFTLYAHLDRVAVQVGQTLSLGDVVGTVGATGIATGPHLHFEVRLGPGVVDNTVNPEIWLKPHTPESGEQNAALAGRVLNPDGSLASVTSIVLQPIDPADSSQRPVYLETYANIDTHGDATWHENFAVGDLPAGTYRLAFIAGKNIIDQRITLEAGKVTVVVIHLEYPV
ncbi:MAG: M23 family metallopeptidase [Anaerolineaceae bacterium]